MFDLYLYYLGKNIAFLLKKINHMKNFKREKTILFANYVHHFIIVNNS